VLLCQELEHRPAVRGLENGVPLIVQDGAYDGAQRRFVVDDEHGLHAPASVEGAAAVATLPMSRLASVMIDGRQLAPGSLRRR
jgi:hypothetical protein